MTLESSRGFRGFSTPAKHAHVYKMSMKMPQLSSTIKSDIFVFKPTLQRGTGVDQIPTSNGFEKKSSNKLPTP